MTNIPIEQQVICVKREIAMRERAYPRWTESGKMTKDAAAREIATMRAVLETVEAAAAKGRLL